MDSCTCRPTPAACSRCAPTRADGSADRHMLPVFALVGRPNVGKSTLFNVLTRTRDALVADLPGLTRDRQYGYGRRGGRYIVVDTGGLVESPAGVDALTVAQTGRAVAE